MKTRSGIKKAIAGLVVAGAVTLTSLPGGVVHADQNRVVDAADYVIWRDASRTQVGVGDLQEVTISKSMDW